MIMPKVYQVIASTLSRIKYFDGPGIFTANRASLEIDLTDFVKKYMPSGSGLDSGVKLLDTSTENRLIFQCDFHHMDENGFYDGWTSHTFIVTPSLQHGYDVRVTGRDRNQIKDYIADTLGYAVSQEVPTGWLVEDAVKDA